MAANDLIGGIALDARGAGVPIGNDAAGIDHENGVVGDALHQQAEPALALDERLPRFVPLGDVTRDLGRCLR
jgi:hypothetical protein